MNGDPLAVQVQGVGHRYGGVVALDDIELVCLLYTSDAADE